MPETASTASPDLSAKVFPPKPAPAAISETEAMCSRVIDTIPVIWQTLPIKIRDKGQTEWRDAEIMLPVTAVP